MNVDNRCEDEKNSDWLYYVRSHREFIVFKKASAKMKDLFDEKKISPKEVCKTLFDFLKNPYEFAK